MKSVVGLLLFVVLVFGCKSNAKDDRIAEKKVEFNQGLTSELKEMAEIDQVAANIPEGKYKEWSVEKWNNFKDSVFVNNQIRIEQIFNEFGFVGFDLAGEEGSTHFWLIVQHSDHNPDFQKRVLEKMKMEVEKENANPSSYGLLVDRVKINTGEKQIYGTQVSYNFETGQAYSGNLLDSLTVNERRKSIGLPPLEEYLNQMTEMHFEMNKLYFLDKGISKPKLYNLE
ncbi:DUF6624 domain-containing protein [Algoriphagus sp.]|uniref:DUF6624 domain-containing protein n=1 Tax=Algoriphagus sp. TaxID=1872435 RepID=UPI00391D2CA0